MSPTHTFYLSFSHSIGTSVAIISLLEGKADGLRVTDESIFYSIIEQYYQMNKVSTRCYDRDNTDIVR